MPRQARVSHTQELTSLRDNLHQVIYQPAHWAGPATQEQIRALQTIFNELLDNPHRDTRLKVVTILLSYNEPLTTFNDITKWDAKCLINWLKVSQFSWEIRNGAESTVLYIASALGSKRKLKALSTPRTQDPLRDHNLPDL